MTGKRMVNNSRKIKREHNILSSNFCNPYPICNHIFRMVSKYRVRR